MAKAQSEADKAVRDAEATLRGVCARVNRTQRALYGAQSAAGDYPRWDVMTGTLARKLAGLAEHTTRWGA